MITDFRKEIINLAKYLTHYYIKADMFTGYHDTENSDDNTLDPIAHNHVEVKCQKINKNNKKFRSIMKVTNSNTLSDTNDEALFV